jgi:hypothetical protein
LLTKSASGSSGTLFSARGGWHSCIDRDVVLLISSVGGGLRWDEWCELVAWQEWSLLLLENLCEEMVEQSSSGKLVEMDWGTRRQSLWRMWFLIDLNLRWQELHFVSMLLMMLQRRLGKEKMK